MAIHFPDILTEPDESWEEALAEEEKAVHRQAYDRGSRVAAALHEAGMDAWLDPTGNNNSTISPQYQLQRRGGETKIDGETLRTHSLATKMSHRNFHIATLFPKVKDLGGTLLDGPGVCLYDNDVGHPIALPSQTEAFQFIDSVLIGMEKEAIDLGVLAAAA